MNRVLILGGYGGFGARLSRRLAGDGWTVIVAGRDIARARGFARTLQGSEALRADREGDLVPVLAEARPDLLIDAAGPFQGNSYRVPQACIAAGVHYTDLADARDFVCGIGELDHAARTAGVAVLAGASTVPALTGAVLRELAAPLDRVDAVDMALGASTAATGGALIAAAALSYAGKPIRVWHGRRWSEAFGLHGLQRRVFAVAGRRPVTRWVALADIPDLELAPQALPGAPAASFRAGNESAAQMIAGRMLSALVRQGWLRSLTALGGMLLPLQRRLARYGSTRSAMSVEAAGWRGDEPVLRRWTVIAEDGDGPEIPVLAAQLVARRLRDGALEAGARDTSRLFALGDFGPLLGGLRAATEIEETAHPPVYRRVMGAGYDRLPEPVRTMHAIVGDGGAEGEGTVERGAALLARLAGAIGGFPPAGHYPVHVAFAERDGIERWTRSFGLHRFHSHLSQAGRRIEERFGPLRFQFDLPGDELGLRMVLRGWSAFRIPLPRFLAPRIVATERAEGDDFVFDVAVALPLVGPVVHYRGRLRRV
ncbi:SDR family oxidoreductase [Pelagerythrobacter sp.]|uniref:SDR family oxidoreductase n=1 Tax=Pelagerythrobacter sp. TaxID=2800702 RepID=UPI0035B0FB6E